MRSLVWFRSDLRLADNPALFEACRSSTNGVVAVFTACPDQWREHDMADVQAMFVLRTLRTLRADLERLRIPLRVLSLDRFADVPVALLDLARVLECDTLWFNREYEVNETRRDEQVENAFRAAGLGVRARHDQTVVAPGELQTGTGGDYTVYTPFKNAWIKLVDERGLEAPLPEPDPQERMICNPDEGPAAIPGFDAAADLPELWPAGESEARRRLGAFAEDGLSDYVDRRDLPAHYGTSTLSPYLATGAISARTCLHAAVDRNGGKLVGRDAGANTWIQELIWREFYRNVAFCFPRVCMGRPFKLHTEAIAWRHDEEQFEAWCQGRTGVPIVDAGMRQLLASGWMHNRVRMVTAMFLTKQLLIDWRWGERWFMRHLIDGDLASNNGGWQWSASTGTDAAPYFRIFNPFSQSKRFDANGDYIGRWVPELDHLDGRAIHDLSVLPELERSVIDYPRPIVDHRAGRARALAEFKSVGRA